jgi:hypothetical protein
MDLPRLYRYLRSCCRCESWTCDACATTTSGSCIAGKLYTVLPGFLSIGAISLVSYWL